MTKLKDNPMDESANPTPRGVVGGEGKANNRDSKDVYVEKNKKEKEPLKRNATHEVDKNSTGKTDDTAYDARNNNLAKK